MGFHPVGVHVVAVGKRFLRVIMVEILISFHLNCSLNDFGFDFQRDEVSFSFLLSHPTALSCIQWSDTYIDAARAGHPYDVNNLPREPLSLMYLFLALGIGLVLAWVVVSVMKSQLRSVAFQENAASYVREDSMNLTNSRELFLYRDVHRTERPKESSSSDSGGSSTHTSSSGTTHGGGGGSF